MIRITVNDFLLKYKLLEKRLKQIAGCPSDYDKFRDIIERAKQYNPIIEYKESILWDLYGLRNVFAHTDREKYIASVNGLALKTIDELLELIENPPKVGQFFGCEVFTANTNEITEIVLRKMQQSYYTHIPIYKDSKFIGLLTETTLLDWLIENINEGKAQFYKLQIKDINPKYLNCKFNRYKFIPPDVSIFDVMKEFENAIDKEIRLGALLISMDGTPKTRLVGIITAWDLPKIKELLI